MNIVNLIRNKIYYVQSYKISSDKEQNISYTHIAITSSFCVNDGLIWSLISVHFNTDNPCLQNNFETVMSRKLEVLLS